MQPWDAVAVTMEWRQPCRPCGPRAWRASTKTGWNWTIGAAQYPPPPQTTPTLPPIAPGPDHAPGSFQKKEAEPRETGTSSLPPRTTARVHTSRRADLSQNPSRTWNGRRRAEVDVAPGMLRAGGDRRRRGEQQPLLPSPLCSLLTRWSPLLSVAAAATGADAARRTRRRGRAACLARHARIRRRGGHPPLFRSPPLPSPASDSIATAPLLLCSFFTSTTLGF